LTCDTNILDPESMHLLNGSPRPGAVLKAPWAFRIANRVRVWVLYGRAGRTKALSDAFSARAVTNSSVAPPPPPEAPATGFVFSVEETASLVGAGFGRTAAL
jgi:hypothetical protein